MDYRKLNNIFGWGIFLISSIVYIMTIEPTVSLWDCGEYITTAYKLEVGHPPGAPLFMMLGRLFSMFSGGDGAAYMINVMSALSSSGTVLFLFWTITMLARKTVLSPVVSIFNQKKEEIEEIDTPKEETRKSLTDGQKWAVLGSGLVGGLVYTFTDSAWFSAVEGEVYAMSSFFTAIVIWAIFKWDAEYSDIEHADAENEAPSKNPDRWLVFIFFMIGLSIGVHLLNLLCIPAIGYVIYFRKFKKTTTLGFILTGVIGVGTLGFIQAILIPKTVSIAAWFELMFTNSLGMPFNTGTIFFFLLILGLIVFGLKWSRAKAKPMVNTIIWSISMIFIGYSCFAMIVIRSNANTPLDENDPENLVTLQSYLEREQYGDWPILYGQYFTADPIKDRSKWDDMNDIYLRRFVVQNKKGKDLKGFKTEAEAKEYVAANGGSIVEKYFQTFDGENQKPTYDPAECTFFPRMYSPEGRHVNGYKNWSGHKGDRTPTMGENLSYFFSYQVNWMYWRYFMWNFSGRQSDEQGHGSAAHGNWMSGLNFIDKHHIGDQTNAPSIVTNNASNNKFYMLPLILGLIGFIFMLNKSTKGWWIVMLLFLLTGLAIIIYLNQKPIEPRERDYAYAGSFYAFSMFVGMSVLALYDAYKHMVWKELGIIVGALAGLGIVFSVSDTTAAVSMIYIAAVIGLAFGVMIAIRNAVKQEMQGAIIALLLCLPVPMLMGAQGWDDHDRSGRYTAQALPENYLASCNPNSIIFTNGDNDTFPLWYLQEVEGKGTDIRVCNLSLLNTDWYTEQMTRKAYDSEPLPISFSEEQYRQHGYRDFMIVAGTNRLTLATPEISEKWKPIMDLKIESNPEQFAAGYKTACTNLANILRGTEFERLQPDYMEIIPGLDTTHTYYQFRTLVLNILGNGVETYKLNEQQLSAVQDVLIKFNDSFDYLPADYVMDYLGDDANLQDNGSGRLVFILPSKGLSCKVNKENVKAAGIVEEKDYDRIQDEIRWRIPKDYIYKADLMILDIVAHHDWNRGIYFASSAERSTYLGLHGHFYAEGLVYKLVPFQVDQQRNPNALGEVNQDKMYDNLMNVFKWGNMDKDGILVDYYTRRLTNNYRVQFSVLADSYGEDLEELNREIEYLKQIETNLDSIPDTMSVLKTPIGDVIPDEVPNRIKQAESAVEEIKVKVNAVLDKSLEVMPHKNVPFGKVLPSYIQSYYLVGNEEKGEALTNQMFELYVEEIDYYLSLDPEFSGQEAMIDELFGAYRGVFSLYQTVQVYSTNEAYQQDMDNKFREKTCEVCTALPKIEKNGASTRQKIAETFTAFFQRIQWDCNIDCMFSGGAPQGGGGGTTPDPNAIPGAPQ